MKKIPVEIYDVVDLPGGGMNLVYKETIMQELITEDRHSDKCNLCEFDEYPACRADCPCGCED